MSSGVRSVLKTVAMIAVPFVAAVAAPFLAPVALTAALGATAATGLTGAALGAGLGAATGAITGRGAGTGALIGGLGGGFGAGLGAATGGLGGMLPGYGGAAGLPTALPGAAGITPLGGVAAGATPTGFGVGGAGVGSGIAGAVAPSAGTVSSGLLSKLVGGISVGGLANLAMTLYNKPETQLSPTERAALMETAQLAQTNQDLFKKRVEDAVTLRNMATPNPEQAFAESQSATQRGLREAQRRYGASYGGTGADARAGALERQAAIEGVRSGTAAVRGEMARGFEQTRQAMAAMPTEAPGVTPAGVAMQFEDLKRKRQTVGDEQTNKAVGGLFGTSPRSNAGLFSSLYPTSELTLGNLFS